MRQILLVIAATGLESQRDHRVIEVGAIELLDHIPTGRTFHEYFNPERNVPEEAFRTHGLSNEFLSDFPPFSEHAGRLQSFMEDSQVLTYHAESQVDLLNDELARGHYNIVHRDRVLDLRPVAKQCLDWIPRDVNELARELNVKSDKQTVHGALLDCMLLAEIYRRLLSLLAHAASRSIDTDRALRSLSDRVFVVHGHDGEAREAVARFIEKLGLKPVILDEQANRGRMILEKFEQQRDIGFAIVLLTPDDFGGKVGSHAVPRARQNVILELGYFIGSLGRDRVCALKRGDLELPSDVLGIAWTPFDSGRGWQIEIARELKEAGYTVDLNKALS